MKAIKLSTLPSQLLLISRVVLSYCELNVSNFYSLISQEYLSVKSLTAGSPVKKVVQSLARFMARYFTNSTVYVFPPHNPHHLPPLYSPYSDCKYTTVIEVVRVHTLCSCCSICGEITQARQCSLYRRFCGSDFIKCYNGKHLSLFYTAIQDGTHQHYCTWINKMAHSVSLY